MADSPQPGPGSHARARCEIKYLQDQAHIFNILEGYLVEVSGSSNGSRSYTRARPYSHFDFGSLVGLGVVWSFGTLLDQVCRISLLREFAKALKFSIMPHTSDIEGQLLSEHADYLGTVLIRDKFQSFHGYNSTNNPDPIGRAPVSLIVEENLNHDLTRNRLQVVLRGFLKYFNDISNSKSARYSLQALLWVRQQISSRSYYLNRERTTKIAKDS